jgi:hypothetical protein
MQIGHWRKPLMAQPNGPARSLAAGRRSTDPFEALNERVGDQKQVRLIRLHTKVALSLPCILLGNPGSSSLHCPPHDSCPLCAVLVANIPDRQSSLLGQKCQPASFGCEQDAGTQYIHLGCARGPCCCWTPVGFRPHLHPRPMI